MMAAFGSEGDTIVVEGAFMVNDNTKTFTVRDEDGGKRFDATINGSKIAIDMGEYTPLLVFEKSSQEVLDS